VVYAFDNIFIIFMMILKYINYNMQKYLHFKIN
jgi:hypothetical protein